MYVHASVYRLACHSSTGVASFLYDRYLDVVDRYGTNLVRSFGVISVFCCSDKLSLFQFRLHERTSYDSY